jgi:hypothetical protein
MSRDVGDPEAFLGLNDGLLRFGLAQSALWMTDAESLRFARIDDPVANRR